MERVVVVGVRGGDTLLGCEAARSPMIPVLLCDMGGVGVVWGVWLVLPGPWWRCALRGLVWGCFLRTT